MRISVYVPDGLWVSSRAAFPDESISEIARRAVRSLIAAANAPGPIFPTPAQRRLVEAEIASKEAEAGSWFELGYGAGLHLAQNLEWWVLEQMELVGWTLAEMCGLASWTIIRDDLRAFLTGQLAAVAALATGLIAELDQVVPRLRGYAVFGNGLRRALAAASSDGGEPAQEP